MTLDLALRVVEATVALFGAFVLIGALLVAITRAWTRDDCVVCDPYPSLSAPVLRGGLDSPPELTADDTSRQRRP